MFFSNGQVKKLQKKKNSKDHSISFARRPCQQARPSASLSIVFYPVFEKSLQSQTCVQSRHFFGKSCTCLATFGLASLPTQGPLFSLFTFFSRPTLVFKT
jgi:hypothetical protein